MEGALADELTSINSIYGDNTLTLISEDPSVCTIRFPCLPSVLLRLEFPLDYPNAPPSVLGTESVGTEAPKGSGQRTVQAARDVLSKAYRPGEACIFDLIEEVNEIFQDINQTAQVEDQNTSIDHHHHHHESTHDGQEAFTGTATLTSSAVPSFSIGPEPPWILAVPVTEKKSVFQARAANVTSPSQAKQYLQHLLATDRKAARATHNITAWRIQGADGTSYQDCDDDGEAAAGGRVLHLMQLMGVWNVMVIVTRWYGGILLGPDRFRIINKVARDALLAGAFLKEDQDAAGKKKAGKK